MSSKTSLIHGNLLSENHFPGTNNGSAIVHLPGTYNNSHTEIGLTDDTLSKHTLLVGGTGCGKTNLMYFFVDQIKKKMTSDDVLVVFDTKGDFFKKFYNPKKDYVIGTSPKYERVQAIWNIYKDIIADGWNDDSIILNTNEITFSLFREAIDRSQNPFFPSAARDLFAAILLAQLRLSKDSREFRQQYLYNSELRYYMDTLNVEKLTNMFTQPEMKDLSSVLMYIGNGKSNQALGVLGEMQNVVRQLLISSFAKQGGFSVRNFVREKGAKTLFIEYDLSVGDTLTPIYRLLFDLAFKEALGRNEASTSGKVYFICDELKLLPHLQHLEDGVNFGRSLGVRVIAGLQSIEQLNEIYGQNKGNNIVSGFSSIYAFRSNDTITRNYVSELHGKNIVLDQFQNSSGTILEEKREGKTVEDWDLLSLKVGDAVVSLPFSKPFLYHFDVFRG